MSGTTTATAAGPATTDTTERDLVPPTHTSRAPRPAGAAAALRGLAGSLIVSCQALPGEALHGPDIMARMARAAVAGGAAAVRINGPEDVAAVRRAVTVPLIGLWKDGDEGVYITPTLGHARRVAEAGADLVALDATRRPRRDGLSLPATIEALHRLGIGVLADVSTHEEGLAAAAAGADAVATTLSGYTADSTPPDGPDFTLVASLAAALDVPLIAEGRIATPAEAARALALGAHAVVVGGAITRPTAITERFAAALPRTTARSWAGAGPAPAAGADPAAAHRPADSEPPVPTPSVPSPVTRRTAEEPTT